MGAALAAAREAGAAGDVPVGAAVLGPDDSVIAVAGNRRERDADPTGHAEVLAIRAAAGALGRRRLEGCALVVTLEPCTMCAGALVAARVGTLVFGAFDPGAGAVASLFDVVRDPRLNHRPRVVGGIMAGPCAAVLDEFFAGRRGGGVDPRAGDPRPLI
ncbi:nucleoside deaminase [uncultured Propionibacterium sp.]|uniref:nucleoside deaminase n=1 Tax=uncultured Propionibacterium sp. TaxID=218066 RepID=UPI00292D4716|nr:nucleoside deaminase [uncultured Propionibacterium sp.]